MDFQIDRREYIRIPFWYPITYRLKGHTETHHAFTKNISKGGILIRTNQTLPVDSDIELEIFVPELKSNLTIQGKTTWFQEIEANRYYHIGIDFKNLSQKFQDSIQKLIQTFKLK